MNASAVTVILALFMISACSTLPPETDYPPRHATPSSLTTRLGAFLGEWEAEYGTENSGYYPLSDASDALAARLKLIDVAQESIDLQYFLMKDDFIGEVFTAKLLEAADRGVRIRFLLDDIFTTTKDAKLVLLNQHPHIEVRLFNPISRRGFKSLNFLADFKQANRRMHNKSFTVDGAIAVVGGRNIANEYFALNKGAEFFDFDLLTIGPIVSEIAKSFDEYWNYKKSLSVSDLDKLPSEASVESMRQKVADMMQREGLALSKKIEKTGLAQALAVAGVKPFIGPSVLMYDYPSKLATDESEFPEQLTLVGNLVEALSAAQEKIVIVTPYFIPRKRALEFFSELIARGVEVEVITNSLSSTNHDPVHAHYAKYRKRLLKAGVQLYETRKDAAQRFDSSVPKNITSTLHTKLIFIDNRYVFVGSLNLDPRSVVINAEMGILIDSPKLVHEMTFERGDDMLLFSYKVELDKDGKLKWIALENDQIVKLHSEPSSNVFTRMKAMLLRLVPESQM